MDASLEDITKYLNDEAKDDAKPQPSPVQVGLDETTECDNKMGKIVKIKDKIAVLESELNRWKLELNELLPSPERSSATSIVEKKYKCEIHEDDEITLIGYFNTIREIATALGFSDSKAYTIYRGGVKLSNKIKITKSPNFK